jgi:hypothetical protein
MLVGGLSRMDQDRAERITTDLKDQQDQTGYGEMAADKWPQTKGRT